MISEIISKWRLRPFARGTADCCAFADFVGFELTGKHYLPWTYATDGEADSILERFGGLGGALIEALGEPDNRRQPGDVVLLTILDHETVGIVLDDEKAVTMFEDGMLRAVSAGFIDASWSWA